MTEAKKIENSERTVTDSQDIDLAIPELPDLPPELQIAVDEKSLVLFVGAGISRLVKCPDWNTFADKVLDQLVKTEEIDFHERQLIARESK